MKATRSVLLLLLVMCLESSSWAQGGEVECGKLKNHFGPYDYRTATADTKLLVEQHHFTPKVENLVGGEHSISAGGDMAYTLNVFPNHHRALMALIKLAKKEKTNRPRDMGYTVECRFDRAERFAPDDSTVQMLHGIYLLQTGKNQEAVKKLEGALELAGDNANLQYNIGLAYFEVKDYDKALLSAHRAYQMGYPLPGLRRMLEKAGKWKPLPVSEGDPSRAQN